MTRGVINEVEELLHLHGPREEHSSRAMRQEQDLVQLDGLLLLRFAPKKGCTGHGEYHVLFRLL